MKWIGATSILTSTTNSPRSPPPHTKLTQRKTSKGQLATSTMFSVPRSKAASPRQNPAPHTKRWWSKELTQMKKDSNHLNHLSYKFRALPDHLCHKASKTSRNKLADTIFKAKREHWQNWLEEATESDVWTAHKYIKAPTGDGSCSRIPTLTGKADNSSPITATTNQEKGELLAKILFPLPQNHLLSPLIITTQTQLKTGCL